MVFIETPFLPVINGQVQRDQEPQYMTADQEDDLRVAPGDIPTDENNYIFGRKTLRCATAMNLRQLPLIRWIT